MGWHSSSPAKECVVAWDSGMKHMRDLETCIVPIVTVQSQTRMFSEKHFANLHGEMNPKRNGDTISACGWQISAHAMYNARHYDDDGKLVEGRFIRRAGHTWIQVCNIHFRPEESRKPDQAKAILGRVLRLCFKRRP